jgi:[ribosomal protein S18]-alanine N-acetyltransferase
MYGKFGFRSAGRRRRYYHDNGEDALIMWFESRARAGVA